MKFRFGRRPRYIVLQDDAELADFLSVEEQKLLRNKIINVLPPVSPAEAFVAQLEQALIEEAVQRATVRQQKAQLTQTLGFVLGGVLSIIGGIVAWVVWHRRRGEAQRTSPHPIPAIVPAN